MSSMIDVHDGVLPGILIVESDPEVAELLASAMGVGRDEGQGLFACDPPRSGCVIVESIASLHRLDLRRFGAALVASARGLWAQRLWQGVGAAGLGRIDCQRTECSKGH